MLSRTQWCSSVNRLIPLLCSTPCTCSFCLSMFTLEPLIFGLTVDALTQKEQRMIIILCIILPRALAQGIKHSVCLSVVIVVVVVIVVGMEIARSRILGIYVCCKHNQSVDIGEKLVCTHFKLHKKAYILVLQIVHFLFSITVVIDHTYSFSKTYADATAHAQAQCWKGSSSSKTAMPQSVATLRYSGYRARGVCALVKDAFHASWLR